MNQHNQLLLIAIWIPLKICNLQVINSNGPMNVNNMQVFIPHFTDGSQLPPSYIGNGLYNYYDTEESPTNDDYYFGNNSYYIPPDTPTCSTNNCENGGSNEYALPNPYSIYPSYGDSMKYLNSEPQDAEPEPIKCQIETECSYQKTIPANITDGVEVLSLRWAVFEEINIGDLSDLPELTKLKITYSDLKLISPGSFQNLQTLKILELDGNDLSDLLPGTFTGLTKLESLDVTNNHVAQLQYETFRDLSKLRTLILAMNDLTRIMNGTFELLEELEVLDLQSNKIAYLHPKAFVGLNNLKTLRLDYNKISIFPTRSLKMPRRLSSINLSGNNLTSLERNSLRGLRKLRELNVESCGITTIHPRTFRGRRIEILNLSHNKLVRIPDFGQIPTIDRLYLDNNPWHCDCELVPAINFLVRNTFSAPIPELKCASPLRLLDLEAMLLQRVELCPPPGMSTPVLSNIGTTPHDIIIQTEPDGLPTEYPLYPDEDNDDEPPTRGRWVYDDDDQGDTTIPPNFASENPTTTAKTTEYKTRGVIFMKKTSELTTRLMAMLTSNVKLSNTTNAESLVNTTFGRSASEKDTTTAMKSFTQTSTLGSTLAALLSTTPTRLKHFVDETRYLMRPNVEVRVIESKRTWEVSGEGKTQKSDKMIIFLFIACAAFVGFVLLIIATRLILRRKKVRSSSNLTSNEKSDLKMETSPRERDSETKSTDNSSNEVLP